MSLLGCIHKGPRQGTYNVSGVAVDAFKCNKLSRQCAEGSEAFGMVDCSTCDYYIDYPTSIRSCAHRGEVVRSDVSNLCGARGKEIEIYRCAVHGECAIGRYCHGQKVSVCLGCPDATSQPVNLIAPSQGKHRPDKPHEGRIPRKPWQYQVTCVIPVLDTPEPLEAAIACLRAQSLKPYIVVIDTGSVEHRERIEALADIDLEVHQVRCHAWRHSSEPVSVACQLGQELCRSPFIFQTHADCFLRRRDLLEDWVAKANVYDIVGYQISPRPYEGWETELGHTALMMRMDAIRGLSWNMDDYCDSHGVALTPSALGPNNPDTESQMNAWIKTHDVSPLVVGGEDNFKRNVNADFDHPRSYCGSVIYQTDHHVRIKAEMEDAIIQAYKRAAEWRAITAKK